MSASSFNYSLVRRIMAGFSLVFENAEPTPMVASSSGSRLRVASALTRQWDTAFLHLGGGSGTRRLVLVVDMSGSMGGMWETGGREFVWALMMMARSGAIDLRVFLTGSHIAECPITLPFDQFLRLRPGHSREGYRDSLNHPVIAGCLAEADCAICWTDGQLTDGCVEAAEWRARNIHLVGATLVDPKARTSVHMKDGSLKTMTIVEAMRTHFHSAFANPCAVKLATQLATDMVTREPRDLR
jgi:hypothetical protein